MPKGDLHIERRPLEPGRPVIIWPGRSALYAAYDPKQIHEEDAVAAIALLVPGAPHLFRVIRTGERGREISDEDIAKHGQSRSAGKTAISMAFKEA